MERRTRVGGGEREGKQLDLQKELKEKEIQSFCKPGKEEARQRGGDTKKRLEMC